MRWLFCITILVIWTHIVPRARCDYYTSVVSLIDLLDAEMKMVDFFEDYMAHAERISEQVNATLNEIAQIVSDAEGDPEDYYENPLNAFRIISRFVIDWENIKKIIFDDTYANAYLKKLESLTSVGGVELPTNDDLHGAARGLARLQRTYALDTQDVAEGFLTDLQFSEPLSAHECFILGRTLHEVKDFQHAAEWLLQARTRLAQELKASNYTYSYPYVTDVQILEFLAPTMSSLNKNKMAMLLNEEILAQDAQNVYALGNRVGFEQKARKERHFSTFDDLLPKPVETPNDELFDKVCRGEIQQTPRQKRDLRCRYVHNNVPFCRIAPFRKEELNLDPEVSFYHQSIYDSEIESIINNTIDTVERSRVGDLGNDVYSDIRTSQNAWLDFQTTDYIKKLEQRLEDITGLSMETGEHLQVVNYGIGGHYAPHYDFSENLNEDYGGKGNRILTALFYINDVELGGATAFPHLHLAAHPQKGSAVVWFDMHKSLELDYRTKHGGCPVLVGSKWVCNEWFHQYGQEFKRPCGLKPDGYKSINFKETL